MFLTPGRRTQSLLVLSLVLLASSALGVQTEVRILIDSDRNLSTGCTVLTAGGPFSGVERMVSTTYDTVGSGLAVTGVTEQQCVSGSMTASTTIDAGGWAVGTAGGNQMLETHVPWAGTLTSMRLGFTITNGTLADAVLQHPNGDPIVFPNNHTDARRRAVFSGGDFPITLDGNSSDWSGIFPLAPGSSSFGTASLRFLNIFATEGDADVFFRLDIQANRNAPTANDDAYTTLRGSTLTVAAPGVLGNDSDPSGLSLTAVLVSGPQHGMLTLNANGSFTYVNDGSNAPVDSFRYKANNGSADSNTALVTLTIIFGTAPVITSANNTTFTVGTAGSFTVTKTGNPTPTLSMMGTLPAGVSFNATTGVLSGTPAPGTGRTYSISFTATNLVGTTTQNFTLTVREAPSFTSANSTSFTVGTAGAFLITTNGFPRPAINESGALPAGVTFTDNGNGTATLSGTPTASGIYPISFTATNGIGVPATQNFTLTVNQMPAITSANATTFTVGTAGSFTVTATGFPTPTFSENGALPAGVTFNAGTGVLSGTPNAGTGGVYTITFSATNAAGTTNQTFTLTVNQAPSITAAAANQTVCAGATATFVAAASGFPAPTVQWQVSTNGGVTFNNIPGATSTTYSFVATPADNGNLYRAVFTNSSGTAQTTATLTVNTSPAVTANPANQTVCAGASATFAASASGSPAPAVQWQRSNDGGTTFSNISGANATTYTFATVAADNGSQYRAVFTNACGMATTTAATLTVNTAPVVTTNPATQTVCDGTTATFTAAASGSPAPTVQWQVSTDGGTTFNNMPGETANTLSFMAVLADNGKQFRAVFTNTCSTATTAAAILNVTSAPVVTTNPTNQTVCSGSNATFTAAASPAATVQWQKSTDGGSTFNNIPGATSTTLTFMAAALDNNNQYRAVFTNLCGTATTTAATLTVNVAPAVTTQPTNQTVCAGATATFTAAASGTPAPTVQWQVASGGPFTDIPGETSTTLNVVTVAADNGKQYRAVFTNSCGIVPSAPATLTVNTAPAVTTNPASQTICSGGTATFTAAASGQLAPTVQWQLSIDGGGTFNPILGATSTTLSFMTNPTDNGHQFRAVFTNTCGTATTTAATLTVDIAPAVTTNPTDQTVCAGTSATFTAAASGTPTPTVQWQVSTNGGSTFTDLPGETSTTLTFMTTSGQNGNLYHAVFTNACGTATTTAATLTVNTAPVVTLNPATQTVCENTSATFTAAASGQPAPTVQWEVSTDNGMTFNPIPLATSTTYSFTATLADNLHQYRAVFTNVCGNATTTPATLTVQQPVVITTQPTDQSVTANNPVTFTSAATNFTSVQWMVSTDNGASFNPVPGATSPTLTYSPPLSDNGKKFKATYTNSCGSVDTNVVTLTVTCPAITVARTGGGAFPAGTFNTAYVGESVTASGGAGPYTFAVTSGALPTNLSLSSGGAISGTPSATGTFTFTVTATDTNLCTGLQSFSIAINPAAGNDSYNNLVNNTEAVVTGGSTSSPTTPFVSLTGTLVANDFPTGGVAATAGTFATSQGGSVTIAADGTFKYTPPVTASALATDTFSYTALSDTGGTGTPAAANATVTLNLAGRVWYVKNNGANGNGQSQSPFNSTSSFTNGARVTPDASGDIIFIFTGDGTTTNQNGGVALLANEQLIGNGVALVVNGNTLVAAGVNPQIGNSVGDGVTLKSANTVKGLTITGSFGNGIYGTGALGVNTLDVLTVQNSTLAGIRLDNASGTVTWNSGTIVNNTAAGVDIINGGGVNFTYGGNITQTAGAMVNVAGGHNGTLIFNTGTLNATGGTGLQFDNADGAYTFNGTVTLNGGDAGVDILNGSGGTFTFTAGTSITNPTGDAFHVNGSAPALVNYFGSISSNAAQAVSITNGVAAACGTQNFTGSITATGAGILINNCNAGTITFSGSTNNFNTFANPAVEVTNIGAAVKFTGGNLTINATSGHGFFVNNGGGTVEVTGNNNTVATTTGLAVQISQVSVGAGGVTFKSVDASGTNGIILSNTGTTGTFTVSGTGTAGSGGTINTSGNAVQIAGNTSLSFMNITGGTGIIGGGTMAVDTVSVTGTGSALSLNTATVTGNFSSVGGTTTGVGANLIGVGGTFTVLGGTLTTSAAVNVLNVNAGNATINWQGTLTQSQNAALMLINGTNTGTITFSGGTLSATNGTGLQFSTANGTYNFNGTTTLNGGDAGIDILVNSTGTFSFGGGVTITNPSGSGFTVNGSTPAVTYSGNISKSSAGLLVDITNQAASARVITFQTGTLTGSGTSTGINLNNVDGTVNFNGATTLSGTAAVSVNTGSSGSISFGAGATMTNVSGTSFTVTASNPIVSYAGSITTNTGTLVSVNALTGNSVTFSGGLTSTAGSTAISVTNNTGGSVTFSGGINSFTTGAADAIVLTTNAGSSISFTGGNLSVTTTTGRGVNASGGGTLTFTGGTNNISSGNTALLLNGIALGAGNLNNVTSSAGTNGISLTSVTGGTLTIAGGSLTGNSGSSFLVSAGTRSITYNGSITQNTGAQKAVDIQNSTGGTITFGGAVNSTAGGVSLLTNTGTTMTFTGGVTLNTGANNAFTATGGGTVNVTGSANTIASTTGTALNVTNTTIGASGLTFRSISSNGALNGILLNNTGSTGGLTVSGNSAGICGGSVTPASPGTIASVTPPNTGDCTGGTIQSSTGAGVSLTSTSSVSLTRMNITGGGDDGITGSSVTGLALTAVNIANNGNADEEHGIDVVNLLGTVTISNSSVTGSFEHNVKITNTAGTLSSLTVTGSNFSQASIPVSPAGGNGFLMTTQGTAVVTTASITDSMFRNNFSNGFLVNTENTSSISTFTVQNSSFDDNNIALQCGQFHSSNFTCRFINDTVINDNRRATSGPNSTSTAIVVGTSSTATGGTMNARIAGTFVGSSSFAGSGSSTGSGIRAIVQGLSASVITITGNTVREAPVGFGLDIESLGSTSGTPPTSDVTITNNNVNHVNTGFNPGTSDFPLPAIYVSGDNQGTAGIFRADVTGNTVPSGTSFNFLGTFIELFEYTGPTGDLRLVDTPPASANATAQLTSTNTGSASASAGVTLISGPINTTP
jgi:hypothetical protein